MHNKINFTQPVDTFHVENHSCFINILRLNDERIYKFQEKVPFTQVALNPQQNIEVAE